MALVIVATFGQILGFTIAAHFSNHLSEDSETPGRVTTIIIPGGTITVIVMMIREALLKSSE